MERSKTSLVAPVLVERLCRELKGGWTQLEGATGPARAAVMAELRRELQRPLLIVCPEEDEAQALCQDLNFFLGVQDSEPDFLLDRPVATLLPEEISPYDRRKYMPSRTRQAEVQGVLYALTQPFRPAITVTSTFALLRRTVPRSLLVGQTEYLLRGAEIDRDAVIAKLVAGGYANSPVVDEVGSFSARGGIVDAFSPLYRWPLRLEFLGDTLESIRMFDPSSQKFLKSLEEGYLVPVREIVLTPEVRARGTKRTEDLARSRGLYDFKMQGMLSDLEQGLYHSDLDALLPLFYEELAPLFAYLSRDTVVVLDDPDRIKDRMDTLLTRLKTQREEREEEDELMLEPEEHLLSPEDIDARLVHTPRVLSHRLHVSQTGTESGIPRFKWEGHEGLRQELAARRGRAEILDPLTDRLKDWVDSGYHVFMLAHTESQLERLKELLEPHGVKTFRWSEPFPQVWRKLQSHPMPQVQLLVGRLKGGQIWPEEKVVFLPEEEIFGERTPRRAKSVSFDREAFLTSLDEITPGDFIIHVEHGVGVYRGLTHLKAGGLENDYLHIEYLGSDKLYLPVTRLDKVQKYTGSEGAVPPLDRMGGTRWAKLKGKVKAAIREMAEELLKLYAEREVAQGYAFSPPDAYFREFEAEFPFEETPDQERAIHEVLKDMTGARPMDRLVCGDVGFGKTEVALRAAMKCVLDRKQAAVLVPTTVLALQHGETFTERFRNYPMVVETLSRFKSAKEQKEILQRLKAGKVDIIIGTHRLLSKDVNFANLGLLVVDEEQRFGVAHKEKIKHFRKNVDVLTLTATPIPRTLNMAFSGIRDISIIQTPPADRRSIRTFVCKFDEEVIREAVTNELARGGQVFFVHNRVGTIQAMAALVQKLVPAARVAIGHGQMEEHELEKVILDFVHRKTNVLVSTTIIENGIDIPTVNTMVVNRADAFGLSQLYQLRGRVGRGRTLAYAYLLVPSPQGLTKDAQKRLATLLRYTELGAGFRVAAHDLEIRGSGNLLGKEQSGHITAVGLDLYLQLIEEAVQELKGQKVRETVEPQVNFHLPAFLPDNYIEDTQSRLHFYKRLSAAADNDALDTIVEEIRDRFGRLPEEATNLFAAIELKILLRRINAAGIDLSKDSISVNLGTECRVDPEIPVKLVTSPKTPYRLTPDFRLIKNLSGLDGETPVSEAKKLLQKLGEYGR